MLCNARIRKRLFERRRIVRDTIPAETLATAVAALQATAARSERQGFATADLQCDRYVEEHLYAGTPAQDASDRRADGGHARVAAPFVGQS